MVRRDMSSVYVRVFPTVNYLKGIFKYLPRVEGVLNELR